MPVLLLLLIGCFDFARAVNAYVTIANASREGARYAIVHPTANPSAIRTFGVEPRILPLDTAALCSVAASYSTDGIAYAPWPSGGIPRSAGAPAPVLVRVVATYRWQASTWLVGQFFPGTTACGPGTAMFASTSVMETTQ
jgi:hypothetical protein